MTRRDCLRILPPVVAGSLAACSPLAPASGGGVGVEYLITDADIDQAVACRETILTKYAMTGPPRYPTATFDCDGHQSTSWVRDCQAFDVQECVGWLRQRECIEIVWAGAVAANTSVFRSLDFRDDAESAAMRHKYLLTGEIGQYYGARFVVRHELAGLIGWHHGEAVVIGKRPDGSIECVHVVNRDD